MNKPRLKVLCVDDHAESAALIERELAREFDCRVVSNAEQALQTLADEAGFAVVVTDYLMPGRNGVELLREVRRDWPDTVGVMVTAMDELDIAIAALHDGCVYRFVRKPWAADELVLAVREAHTYHDLVINERKLREQLARINAELDEKVHDLDEANELLEYWVEFSPAVLYSFSCDDGALHPSYISKNFYRLTGFERTAAVVDARFWQDLLHPGDMTRYRETLAGMTGAESTFAVLEYRVRHRDGNYITVTDSLRAVRDANGDTIEIVGAWMDVSSRA